MEMVDFDIVGSFNNQSISSIDSERTVNLFEYRDPLGKKPKSLISTSGYADSSIVFTGSIAVGFRRSFYFSNSCYHVIGSRIYKVGTSNTVSLIGTINTVTGFVGIDANESQVIFVDGVDGYIYDPQASTVGLQRITDPSFPTRPIDVCALDNFFVVANGLTNNFYLSSYNNGYIWGPGNNPFTVVDFTTGLLNTTSIGNYNTGVPVRLSGSNLPGGLDSNTTYYVISSPYISGGNFMIATSYINAINNIPISSFSSAGTGTFSMDNNGQLQLGSITSHPGTIVACRTLHRRLFLFSQFFTEVWENAGIGTNLPFRRNNSLLIEQGTPAIGSISVGFDKMFFLSQDRDGIGSVMEVIGASVIPISTRALENKLSNYALVNHIYDCSSYLIKDNGLIFYRMNFTLANHTYVYNVSLSNPQEDISKLWHEEETLRGNRHRANTHVYFNGVNYVGDYLIPKLYIVDSNMYTNDGESIRRMRITRPFVSPGYKRSRIDRIHIDILQGEYNTNPNPLYIFCSISRDGGRTYGYIIKAPIGNTGQTVFRSVIRKLGTIERGQSLTLKIEFFGNYRFVVLGAAISMSTER